MIGALCARGSFVLGHVDGGGEPIYVCQIGGESASARWCPVGGGGNVNDDGCDDGDDQNCARENVCGAMVD